MNRKKSLTDRFAYACACKVTQWQRNREARANLKMSAELKRSFMAALLPLIIACIVFSAQTYAYFTAGSDASGSTIQSGNVRIALLETMLPAGGGSPVPYTDPIRVMPATTVSKIVSVRNDGSLPIYVRVEVNLDFLLCDSNLGEATDPSLIGYTPNTEYWTEKNGFYYYNVPLEPGQETQPLFTEVRFDAAMGNVYKDSQVAFRIDADAIQANYTGNSPLTAVGWPERMS